MAAFPEDLIVGPLTEPEQRLIAAARAGEVLELGPEEAIRATVICALACAGTDDWPVAAAGVRISGDRIAGCLRLAHRALQRPLRIEDAEIPGGVDLTTSRTQILSFEKSRIAEGFQGSGSRIEGELMLDGAVLEAGCDIAGATIAGQFSAVGAIFDKPDGDAINAQSSSVAGMFLNNATLKGVCDINSATIADQFSAIGTIFNNPDGDAINAQSSSVAGIFLNNAALKGACNIAGATIAGQFSANDATFDNLDAHAIIAQGSNIAGMFLNNATLKGVCDINSATIAGSFSARGAAFDNPAGNAINAQDSHIDSMVLKNATLRGVCHLNGATITGHFTATSATFDNPKGKAINAQSSCIGSMFLSNAMLRGVCDIHSATITGQFAAEGATFDNPTGDAINAQGSKIAGMFLLDATLKGVCNIAGATITGQFAVSATTFENPGGYAIEASVARIGAWLMRPGVAAAGGPLHPMRVHGALNLTLATIERHLEIRGAKLAAQRTALSAGGIDASGPFLIGGGTRIAGGVHLPAATIRGRLDLTGSRIASAAQAGGPESAPRLSGDTVAFTALDLSEARINHLVMPKSAETRPLGIVDLSRARVGTLTDYAAAWPKAADRKARGCKDRFRDGAGRDADHLVLDGFEYEHLDNPDGLPPGQERSPRHLAKIRRDWLHAQSCEDVFGRLRPQPWRHLAEVLAAQGYEEEARRIAIERRVAQRYAEGTGRRAHWLSSLLHMLADYGFNPWKALGWSGGVIVACALVYAFAAGYCTSATPVCADETVFVRTTAADFVPAVSDITEAQKKLGATYPAFDPLAYSIDVFLPFFDIGTERFWRVNTASRWGIALYYFTVFEQIAGALLASLVVTGFTGLLTRNET